MIARFRHKGLEQFFKAADHRGIPALRIERRLASSRWKACAGARYRARELKKQGREVRLVSPQFVKS
jgi:plasmid maintenance system killer protein